jgi:hypothetical protein
MANCRTLLCDNTYRCSHVAGCTCTQGPTSQMCKEKQGSSEMRTITSIGLLAFLISATDASAACRQASLAGDWHYFASNIVLNEDGSPAFATLEDCTFRITANGIARRARCIDGGTEVPFGNPTRFRIKPDCSIESEQSGLCSTTITGQISKNKQTVSGNATCCCFEDAPGSENFVLEYQNSFTLVKTTPGRQ